MLPAPSPRRKASSLAPVRGERAGEGNLPPLAPVRGLPLAPVRGGEGRGEGISPPLAPVPALPLAPVSGERVG